MPDLATLINDAVGRFQNAKVPSPRFDAEELAAFTLGTTRGQLLLAAEMTADQEVAFEALVARREAREPLQHLLGTAAFRYVELAVGPGVFTPRPETEVVAGYAIDRAREFVLRGRPPLVVDLCTGSGAIALAVADEVPGAIVHAVELGEPALAWTRINVAGTRVLVHSGDALTALPELNGTVDVVVSNPPYIPSDGLIRDAEVLTHDPALALWGGGPDGLDLVRGVAQSALRLLRPGGWFVVEHADLQGPAVVTLLADQAGWTDIASHRDLSGRDRYATARRTEGPR